MGAKEEREGRRSGEERENAREVVSRCVFHLLCAPSQPSAAKNVCIRAYQITIRKIDYFPNSPLLT